MLMYRSLVIDEQLPRDCDSLIRPHQLLRQHGQKLCKRSKPRCVECPLRNLCTYGQITLRRSSPFEPFLP